MKTPFPFFLALFCSISLFAQQPVSFTNSSQLLGNVNGFIYNDCTVDMNGDYLDDVVRVTNNGIYIDYQLPNGTFTQSLFGMNTANEPDWSICAGDLDGNGFNDLLFGGGSAVSFVMANADGTAYIEKPMPGFIFSQRSTMADIDNDGHLDAFVCHDLSQSHPYRNDGNGNMLLDQSLINTYNRPGNYSAIWTDYDNDGDIDLYITKCVGGAAPGDINRTNLLYQNNGDGTFSEVASEAGLADNDQSWSTVFEDFDNDGDFDAFIVNHEFANRLFRNNGDGTFTDVIAQSGIDASDLGAWENASGDFNNDGYMDIFSELSYSLYLGKGDLTFTPQFATITPGAIADLNDDGFLDVVRGDGLFLNNGNNHNWLKVNTIGSQSNINGIGARVEIYGAWGRQIREVRSGQSFAPMSSMQIHFGIGEATEIEKLVVKWPSGIITTIPNPGINTTVNVLEVGCILPVTEIVTNGPTDICPGTSLQLSVPEGFLYTWSTGDTTNTISVSEPGEYSLFMTDTAGCVSLSNNVVITLIQDLPPTIQRDGLPYFCEGGSVTLTSSEGTNYQWSNGMSGQSIVVTESGAITVSVDAKCSPDQLFSEAVEVTAIPYPEEPIVTGTTIQQGESVEITATGENLAWYDQPIGGTLLGNGNTLLVEDLDATSTFFVEANNSFESESTSGGKSDNLGGGGYSETLGHLIFDAWETFILESVRVYVNSAITTRTILLMNAAGDTLAKKSLPLGPGQHVVELDFEVPQGSGFSLRSVENQAGFYRNNNGVSFPYPIGDMGEITSSLFGNGFYYYFYDWKVRRPDVTCPSARVPVTIEVTDASEAFRAAGYSLFPNPAGNEVFLKMESPADRISLLDGQGRMVFGKPTAGNGTEKIALSSIPSGIYMVKVQTGEEVYFAKFAKE